MEELARARSFHHRGLFACPRASPRGEPCGQHNGAAHTDLARTTARRYDGDLYGLSLRTGEGARHVAEPFASLSSGPTVSTARLGCARALRRLALAPASPRFSG